MSKPPQFEFSWTQPEPFALVAESVLDGTALLARKAAEQAEKTQSEKLQTSLFTND